MNIHNINRYKINSTVNKPQSFKGFLEFSAGVQNNMVLNRGLLNGASALPWAIMANNKSERAELLRMQLIFMSLAFVAPIINVPLANRIFMKSCGLTNSIFDNNHKAIQLSNKYLTSAEDTIVGLKKYNVHIDKNGNPKISERFFSSPLEKLFKKITGQKLNDKVDIQALLKKCGNDVNLLRKRISRAKNLTLFSDLFITCATLGGYVLFNNYLTEKKTGKKGYSAELEMANKSIIEERAKQYQKNKNKYSKIFLSEILLISTLVPLLVHRSITSDSKNILTNFIKKHCNWTDYTKGIYMSLFTTILGIVGNFSGLMFFSRNNTERKNMAVRSAVINPVIFGGDILATSLLAKASDKIFKIDLINNNENKSIFRKIFPKYKSLETISKEIADKKISSKNKSIASAIYWSGMGICAGFVAFIAPKICNKITKQDVNEYVKNKKINNQNINNVTGKNLFNEFNSFVSPSHR